MSTATPNPPTEKPRRRRRRWPRVLLAGLALFLLALFAHRLWLPPLVERLAPPLARRFAGLELRLEGLERVDLGGLRVASVRLHQLGEDAILLDLRASDLELDYGSALLLGDLEALTALRCGELRIELDAGAEPAPEEPSSDSSDLELPARLPFVALGSLELVLQRPEAAPIEISGASCSVDTEGHLRLAARHGGRVALLRGTWRERALEELELVVDGKPLVRDSRVDLTRLGAGDLAAELKLAIGAPGNHLDAALEGGALSWEAKLAGFDLARLEEQLPLRLDRELAGLLELRTSGRLELDAPSAGLGQLEFDLGPFAAAGWRGESARGGLRLQGGALYVDRLELRQAGDNLLRLEAARLPLEGTGAANWLERAHGEVLLDLHDLAAILEPAGLAGVPERARVDHHLSLRAQIDEARLQIQEGVLESQAGRVALEQGELWLSETTRGALALALVGQAELSSLEAFGQLFGRDGWSGACQGRLDLTGTWPDLTGGLELAGDGLVIEGQELGRVELELASTGTSGRLELRRLHGESPLGSVDARAACELLAQPMTLELEQLRLERNGQGLVLAEPVRAELGDGRWSLAPLRLEGEAGEIELSGQGSSGTGDDGSAQTLDFELDVSRLRPELLIEPGAPGLPHFQQADLEARGTLVDGRLEFHSTGKVSGLAHARLSQAVDLEWRVEQRADRLRIESLEVLGGARLGLSAEGTLPLALLPTFALPPGPLELRAELHLPLEVIEERHTGSVSLAAQLAGEWRALSGSIVLDGRDLRLPPEWHPAELPAGSLSGSLSLADDLSWDALGLRFGELIDARSSGRLDATNDVSAWLEDPATQLESAELEARLDLGELDLERLAPVLAGYDEAARVLRAGRVSGQLVVRGSPLAPRFDGSLVVDGGRVRLGGGLPTIEALAARLELKDSRLAVERLSGNLGASPFELTGTADLGGASPQLDLALSGEDLLLFRDRSAKVRANTDLSIRGPLEELLVAGRIELTRGSYRPDTRFLNLRRARPTSGVRGFQLFSMREPPLRDARFDIQLGSREAFEIRSTLVRGSMRPRLHLGGDGGVPVLTGEVFLDRSLLELPATRLELTGGTVRFEAENPFVPQVDIVGQTRMLGYDVRANISGDYDTPEVVFTSTPPLSQEDLFLLVLTGKLPTDPEQTDALATANTVAVYLARDTLSRWLADDGPIDEDTLLERLDFAFGQDVSKNGTETVDVAYRLTDKQGLAPEERNFRHLYLTAERDKYEDYNYGLRLVFRLRR